MDTLRALELRHSVRSYTDQPLSGDVLTTLQKLVKEANKEGGLHIQLCSDPGKKPCQQPRKYCGSAADKDR